MKHENRVNSRIGSKGFFAGGGIIAAIAGSLCCIVPVVAMIGGATGFAATFSWIEPFRPYLIFITSLSLGGAWYLKLTLRRGQALECKCDGAPRRKFMRSYGFLSAVTIFAVATLAFPGYAHVFYPSDTSEIRYENMAGERTVTFDIEGMSCSACAAHIDHDVDRIPGVNRVETSYDKGTTTITFNDAVVTLDSLRQAVDATGYRVRDYTMEGK